MASIITADNGSISGAAGLRSSADNTGVLQFAVGAGTTATTITASGLVGIGTTAPTSRLTVNGDIYTSGVVTATTFVGNISGTVTGSITGNAATVSAAQQTASASYYPVFVDSNNATATAESLYTTSTVVINPATGRLGVGTASLSATITANESGGGIIRATRSSVSSDYIQLEIGRAHV